MGVFGKLSQDAMVASSSAIGTTYVTVLDVTSGSGTLTKVTLSDTSLINLPGAYVKVTTDGGTAREISFEDCDVFTTTPDMASPVYVGILGFNTKFNTSLKVEIKSAYNSGNDGRVHYSLDK